MAVYGARWLPYWIYRSRIRTTFFRATKMVFAPSSVILFLVISSFVIYLS
jgi:branched-subunit amino acid transport protein AzlD